MKLTRKKLAPGSYLLTDPEGRTVAHADMTGSHLDDYPWSWYLTEGVRFSSDRPRTGHSSESLKDAVSYIESAADQYGLTR